MCLWESLCCAIQHHTFWSVIRNWPEIYLLCQNQMFCQWQITYLINCMDFLWQFSFLCSCLGTLNKNNLLSVVISAEFKVQKSCKKCLIAHKTVINATQANIMNRLRLQMKKHSKFDYPTCICCLCVVLFVNQASLSVSLIQDSLQAFDIVF